MAPKKLTKQALKALRVRQHDERESRTRYDDPRQVITVAQWAALINVSIDTARTILSEGGPPVIKLAARRVGIRISDHDAWMDRRVAKAAK